MSYFGAFLSRPSLGSLVSAVVAERGPEVQRGLAYDIHERHKLDVYRPREQGYGVPMVFFVYGGGWTSGEREMYGFVGSALASRGIVVVVPDYRLYPEALYPEFMIDIAQAYAWTRENLLGPQSPMFVMGHSAGAHMAALLTYDPSYIAKAGGEAGTIEGFVGLSGPYGYDPTTHERTKDIFATATRAAQVQPVEQVKAPAPRALLMHGLKDKTVKPLNAHRMKESLERAGSSAKVIEFENAGHTDLIVALSRVYRRRAPVLDRIVEFVCQAQ